MNKDFIKIFTTFIVITLLFIGLFAWPLSVVSKNFSNFGGTIAEVVDTILSSTTTFKSKNNQGASAISALNNEPPRPENSGDSQNVAPQEITSEPSPEPTPPPVVSESEPTPPPILTPEPEPAVIPVPEPQSDSVPETSVEPLSLPPPPPTTQSPTIISGGGGGGGGAIVQDATAPDKPVVTNDLSAPFSTSTVTFTGTAEEDATITSDYSSDSTLATNGNWSLTINDFNEGTTTITFFAADESGNQGLYGTSVEVGVNFTLESPVITSPASFSSAFSTNSITFEGTAESGSIISEDYSSSTTTTDGSGNWSMALSGFPEGDTTINFIATKDSLVSDPTNVTLSIDTIAPTLTSFKVLECEYPLSSIRCLAPSETINLSYSANSTSPITYKIYVDNVLKKTTTDTTTTIDIQDGLEADVFVVATDDAQNTATSSSETVNISKMPVVINEIAWAGTESESSDEWIELYNRTLLDIDMSHLKLLASDSVPELSLSGTLRLRSHASHLGYYLIERTDDDATSVLADLTIPFSGSGAGSGLSNTYEELKLVHIMGGLATTTIDITPSSSSCGGSWCAGEASTSPFSMERIDPNKDGSLSSNWSSNDGVIKNGTDSGSNAINGTPKAINAATDNNNIIGYYCEPKKASYFSGSYYSPTDGTIANSGACTYISYSISGKRHGSIFKGTPSNSTFITGHSFSFTKDKTEYGDDFTGNGASQGDDFFTAIFKVRSGPAYNDTADFTSFFTDGSVPAPHNDYGILEWKYGVAP